jgi:hypothetical protein
MIFYLIYFIIFAIAGFLFWKLFAGKKEGDRFNRSFRFLIGKHRIHIHHWILCTIILIIIVILRIYNPIFLGLLFGSILQGLLYKDRFIIVYKDSDFEKIYSKFKK